MCKLLVRNETWRQLRGNKLVLMPYKWSTDTTEPVRKSHNPNSNPEPPEHKTPNIATFAQLSEYFKWVFLNTLCVIFFVSLTLQLFCLISSVIHATVRSTAQRHISIKLFYSTWLLRVLSRSLMYSTMLLWRHVVYYTI